MAVTESELLQKVKDGLGITGSFQDATLSVFISEVKDFMRDAGVNDEVVNSTAAVGCIMRGVSDLWNYGAGSASLSPYFIQRVIQLSMKGGA